MSTDYSFINDINSIIKITRKIEHKKVEEERRQLEESIRLKKEEKKRLLIEERKKQIEEQRRLQEEITKRREEKKRLLEQKKKQIEEQRRLQEEITKRREEKLRLKKIQELNILKQKTEKFNDKIEDFQVKDNVVLKPEEKYDEPKDSIQVKEEPDTTLKKTYTIETIENEPDEISNEEKMVQQENSIRDTKIQEEIHSKKQEFLNTIKSIMNSPQKVTYTDIKDIKEEIESKFTFHSANEDDIDYKLKEIVSKKKAIEKINEAYALYSQNISEEERNNVHSVIEQIDRKLQDDCDIIQEKINAYLTPKPLKKKEEIQEDEGTVMGVDGFTQPMGIEQAPVAPTVSPVVTNVENPIVPLEEPKLQNPIVQPIPMNPDEEDKDPIEKLLDSEEGQNVNSHFNSIEDLRYYVFPWLLPYTYDTIVGLLTPDTELKVYLKLKKDELSKEIKQLKEFNKKIKQLISHEEDSLKVFKLTYFFYKTKTQIDNLNSIIKRINKELK